MEFRPYRRKLNGLMRVLHVAASGPMDPARRKLVVAAFVELVHADRGTLYLLDHAKNELWSDIVVDGRPLTIRLKVGQGLAGYVAMAAVPLVINNVLVDDRFDGRWDKASGYRTETVLAAPMLDPQGEVMGVVQVLNSTRGAFDNDDRKMIEAVASICALAELAGQDARVEA